MAGNMVKEMTTNFGKLDKFEGHDFRRWQKKMHFLLTTLKVVYVLTTPMPELLKDATVEAIQIRELWDSLESKYIAEDSLSKKFLVSNFNNYKMVDSGPVMEHYNELLRIFGQYTQHGLKMDESISISSIIDKLPPSWKDFKHTLTHGKDDLSLKCGKTCHFKRDCRSGKKNNANAGGSRKGSKEQSQDQVDVIAWWIDSGVTTHVCKDHSWFKTYEPVEDESVLYMGDDHFSPVRGKGSMALEFSSEKLLLCLMCYEALDKFRICKTEVELQQNDLVQTLRTDRGGEYYDPVFFQSVGIIHETTAPYTPQQNDVAERKNKALKEMVNSMLSYSSLSEGFWGDAMLTACYLLNRVPNKRNKTTPHELWFYIIEPNDSVSINSIIESRDAIFNENHFSSIPRPKDIIPNPDESQRDDHSDDLYLVEGSRDQVGLQYSYCYSIEEDPRTYNKAMQSRDSAFWKEAIDDEIGSIMENNTWVLSDLPPGCKPLGCKWIFKMKMKVDGTLDMFKARLVIQGFRQKKGTDYFDTYAPVARITTIRLLLALVAIHNLVIHQIDLKTTFLNGDLDEEVYMKQPEGFIMPGNEHKVCKLVKSLYGLKQASKQWHQKFDKVVLSSGFHLNQSDKCVYSKYDDSGKSVIICLHVDDMLIFGTNQNQVDKTKKFLSSRFSMKDMGEVDVIFDASWINHVEDSSSTSGSMFLLGGGAISWASKKQTCITGSTMKYEFVALAAAGKEAEWLRNLIHEIPIWSKPIAPIFIRCDSAPTMARAYS
uniref:Zinc finger, CCHC-type n=1 Tax=Tanacetum cinerariifolium TaxID=118510 RepID=A0A6L2K6H9_TANCI|nr:zinc finger, CCHC-type [Tanacetum cinerariifolium]